MSITLDAEYRDALYDLILVRLSGLGDLWPIIEREEFDEADRLGREFCDALRLVLDDLGWGETGEPATLTLPPDDLRRAFSTLRDHAERARVLRERELAEEREVLEQARLAVTACERVLDAVGRG